MRAVIWLAGCLVMLWASNTLHLWREMRDAFLILLVWLWVFGGAAWVSGPIGRHRRALPVPQSDRDALQKAAQKAAERADLSQGQGPL